MNRFIVLSFLVMGWGYYELSGGGDFVPERRAVMAKTPEAASDPAPTLIAAEAPAPEPRAEPDPLDAVTIVTRAETGGIDALPEPDSLAGDAIAIEADLVAEALAQALGEPVLNTGEPDPLPAADEIASLPDAETGAQPDAALTADAGALREVTGDSVNLREGPGTNFTVLDRLTRGTVVSVLDTGPEGWVYVEADGQIGWMSADFIGPAI